MDCSGQVSEKLMHFRGYLLFLLITVVVIRQYALIK